MNTLDQWQENNAQRLAAALGALRARLESSLSAAAPSSPKTASVTQQARNSPSLEAVEPAKPSSYSRAWLRLMLGTPEKPKEAAPAAAETPPAPDPAQVSA